MVVPKFFKGDGLPLCQDTDVFPVKVSISRLNINKLVPTQKYGRPADRGRLRGLGEP